MAVYRKQNDKEGRRNFRKKEESHHAIINARWETSQTSVLCCSSAHRRRRHRRRGGLRLCFVDHFIAAAPRSDAVAGLWRLAAGEIHRRVPVATFLLVGC